MYVRLATPEDAAIAVIYNQGIERLLPTNLAETSLA
jgi:hypothetical protein